MTKEVFQAEFVKAAEKAEANLNVTDICKAIGISRSLYYRWRRGQNAPIQLARKAVILVLKEMQP